MHLPMLKLVRGLRKSCFERKKTPPVLPEGRRKVKSEKWKVRSEEWKVRNESYPDGIASLFTFNFILTSWLGREGGEEIVAIVSGFHVGGSCH